MKRILCYLLLISILLFAFVGCDTHEDPQPTPDSGGNQTGDINPPADKNEYENNFEDETDLPAEDPYVNVNKTTFYASYAPAKNYKDAEYRTKHYLMSGSIADQNQAPTLADVQPKSGNTYLRNSAMYYADDGNTYFVLDAYGNVANKIYKGGAYVTLEEVAAYVFAFGTVPPNYSSSKSTRPSDSPWGKYLRNNHSKFSGSTTKYPYEPELPNISGCGGTYDYYEIDIGTTGTTAGEGYRVAPYNDGITITRGAARIVYARYQYGSQLIGTYVFYTYNHYNDFQEYLNYEGGWGKMFGNITGGGTLSSKTDYNPTPYVNVQLVDFSQYRVEAASMVCVILPKSLKEIMEVTYAK